MIYDILEGLSLNPSRNAKIDLLISHKDNSLLKRVIHMALDPYMLFYIKKIPITPIAKDDNNKDLEWGLDELKRLSSREVTGNKGIELLSSILSAMSPDNSEVIKRIIMKDLKCGVSTSTANKVFGKSFIPKYPCMLASGYSKKNLDNIKYPAFIQTKMDGMRANIFIETDGKTTVRSRSGRFVETFNKFDIDDYKGKRVVLDGELVIYKDERPIDRKTSNGILNKAIRGTVKEEDILDLKMVTWDIIDHDSFESGICDTKYYIRLQQLRSFESNNIIIIQTKLIHSLSDARIDFAKALKCGEEGVILKNTSSPWEDKRSKHIVKMKSELEIDLLVVGYTKGNGKYEDMLGSLICTTKDGDLEVSVGSGFSDLQREEIKEDIIGTIVSVKYNEVIASKDKDKKSLFLPIFQEIRLDKIEADNV